MNKKIFISLGLVIALSAATIAYADTSIYTDGIGRMHFLGKNAGSAKSNYTNPAHQDLTRKLYDQTSNGITEDSSYDQHPLKNYENTFPDSRFGTVKYWRTKEERDAAGTYKDSVKSTVSATKGKTDYSGQYAYGSTFLDDAEAAEKNVVKTKQKKHWWNKNK